MNCLEFCASMLVAIVSRTEAIVISHAARNPVADNEAEHIFDRGAAVSTADIDTSTSTMAVGSEALRLSSGAFVPETPVGPEPTRDIQRAPATDWDLAV
jgi:hypothetical protein